MAVSGPGICPTSKIPVGQAGGVLEVLGCSMLGDKLMTLFFHRSAGSAILRFFSRRTQASSREDTDG